MLGLLVTHTIMEEERFILAPPQALAAWLRLSVCCARRENGGKLVGAQAFPPILWARMCGLRREDVDAAILGQLAYWAGEDLDVYGYDRTRESDYKSKREAGKARVKRYREKRDHDGTDDASN